MYWPVAIDISFKDISIFSSGGHVVFLINLGRWQSGHHKEHSCEIILNQGMSFKDISYLELWWPLFSAEWNHLCNFGPRLYEEHFCEIILNLDQWF